MITIKRRTLRRIAVLVALILMLGILALTAVYLPWVIFWLRKDYLTASEVEFHQDALVGRRIRVRGYLGNSGDWQTVEACDPPVETFTRFSLSSIELMECEVDQCTMTCPLFAPHIGAAHGAYEIVGTLAYCSDERLCLIDISKIYRVENVTIDLYGGREIPVTPGPASFPVGQQWEP